MYKLREVSRGNYDDRGYSNEETIARLMLSKPEEISKTLTYTFGMDDDRFPLTFLTEGQGSIATQDIKETEWTWKTMGRMKFTDKVVSVVRGTKGSYGQMGEMIDVEFATHWFIEQFGLVGPDGRIQVRIMKDLGAGPNGGYVYRLKITSPNPTLAIDDDFLKPGVYWSMTAPTISESYSKGNRSNVMGPGKMRGQLEFHRYSKEIAGNISNQVVTYEFQTAGGGTTNLWINEEMRQHEIMMRVMNEERLWLAEYNRDINGQISLTDLDNNQPIPHTAGMREICHESNYDTYGEFLTLNKIERTIGDVLAKDTDTGTMNVVLACGKGFMQDFDQAIRDDAMGNGFATPLGDKMISESSDGLAYGKYFRQYKTIDGHIITLKHLNFCDHGTLAEAAKQNGRVHPRSGLPITSHQAFLIDASTYNGKKNIQMIRQKNQIYKIGILKGLTDIPASWGTVPTNSISTEIDMSRYEVKTTSGLQVYNNTKMFHLECVI
uniref:Major capsid protein n=1 Tax=Geladintestivirus 1 TaxID=3233133 RepID=A0AAU8MJC3_9CAUD